MIVFFVNCRIFFFKFYGINLRSRVQDLIGFLSFFRILDFLFNFVCFVLFEIYCTLYVVDFFEFPSSLVCLEFKLSVHLEQQATW